MESTEVRKLAVRLTEDQRQRLTDLTRNSMAPAKLDFCPFAPLRGGGQGRKQGVPERAGEF
jgi:hypothetical protein